MNQEQVKKVTRSNKNRFIWIGFILIIAGTFSFSNHEKIGDTLTLVGAVIVLGSCINNRI